MSDTEPKIRMLTVILTELVGYGALGGVVGALVGLSASSSFAQAVSASIFAFSGGAAVFASKDLSLEKRASMGRNIGALSICLALGLWFGISVNEARSTVSASPLSARIEARLSSLEEETKLDNEHYIEILKLLAELEKQKNESVLGNRYLRSADLEEINLIDQKYRNSDISAEEAYADLVELVRKE